MRPWNLIFKFSDPSDYRSDLGKLSMIDGQNYCLIIFCFSVLHFTWKSPDSESVQVFVLFSPPEALNTVGKSYNHVNWYKY